MDNVTIFLLFLLFGTLLGAGIYSYMNRTNTTPSVDTVATSTVDTVATSTVGTSTPSITPATRISCTTPDATVKLGQTSKFSYFNGICLVDQCKTDFKPSADGTRCVRDWEYISNKSDADCGTAFQLQKDPKQYCRNNREVGVKWLWGNANQWYPYCANKLDKIVVKGGFSDKTAHSGVQQTVGKYLTGYRFNDPSYDKEPFKNQNMAITVEAVDYNGNIITPNKKGLNMDIAASVYTQCYDAALPMNEYDNTSTDSPTFISQREWNDRGKYYYPIDPLYNSHGWSFT